MNSASYIYIIGNDRPTLYIGVTANLAKRMFQHKMGTFEGFSRKYQLSKLLYFEQYPSVMEAIGREKQLKGWHRDWKLKLIRSVNPSMKDLASEVLDPETSSG